jgi:glycine/D-amino acid oxidase-like deaminating enzyme
MLPKRSGLQIQKHIAEHVLHWNSYDNNLKELGSYYLAYKEDEIELRQEYEYLCELGCCEQDNIEWCNQERLRRVEGMSDKFHCGIYFPNDSIIDSSAYSKGLLQYVIENNSSRIFDCQFRSNTKVVDTSCDDAGGYATVHLESGETLKTKHVVVATGAFYPHGNLNGLLRPCYSYLVHVPTTTTTTTTNTTSSSNPECSSNFFTWGFTHDWCYTSGKIRISGEDHYSAYKPSFAKERCYNLSHWTLQQYDCVETDGDIKEYPQQYGLYSETPDFVPLIGFLNNDKSSSSNNNGRICYLLGCNAWGQTILSYCSSLVPGLLGYTELTEEQKEVLSLVSVGRFTELR